MQRILVINPGSTSTKLALFDDERELFRVAIEHSDEELKPYSRCIEQLDFRTACVLRVLREREIPLESLTCVVARGGMLPPCRTGAYKVNPDMLSYVHRDLLAKEHVSNVGCAIADAIARPLNIPAYIYDPVVVDELEPVARLTGIPELEKQSRGHALNTRAMAHKCAEKLGRPFNECTFIVLHMGGGCSTWLFHNGRAIDMYSDDDAGFAPERCGRIQAGPLIELSFSGKYDRRGMGKLVRGNSGLRGYLGTADAREVERRIAEGDERAKLVYDAMIYGAAKGIGDLATVVSGKVDRIIITGGVAHSKYFSEGVKSRVEFISPVEIMPGEFELEALAAGALRVMRGVEKPNEFELAD